jgi:hypothetical protein
MAKDGSKKYKKVFKYLFLKQNQFPVVDSLYSNRIGGEAVERKRCLFHTMLKIELCN